MKKAKSMIQAIPFLGKLGSGANGTVYKVSNTQVCKIEDVWNPSCYHRQVEFDAFARFHPDKFMKLIEHDFATGTKIWGQVVEREVATYIYEPCLDGTCQSVLSKTRRDPKEMTNLVLQCLQILNTLRAGGWTHNDFHLGNLMYRNSDPKQWFLIDYGNVERSVSSDDLMLFVKNILLQGTFELTRFTDSITKISVNFEQYVENIEKLPNFDAICSRIESLQIEVDLHAPLFSRAFMMFYPHEYMTCMGMSADSMPEIDHSAYQNLATFCVEHRNQPTYDLLVEKAKELLL